MLVYRPKSSSGPVRPLFESVLRRVAGALPRHEELRNLLIDWGEVESAVCDSLWPERDDVSEESKRYRALSECLGRAFAASYSGASAGAHWENVRPCVDELWKRPPAEELHGSVPEGYAYYALYPEQYLEAAMRFFERRRPERVVCLGIRSIGSSLSAAVAGALQIRGCSVRSYCVRPHGHPFDRRWLPAPGAMREVTAERDACFCIVDEGPGLSGTSLTSVAEALSEAGVDDERIVLFPSWDADPERFVSERARRRWARHERYTAQWLPEIARSGLREWSGGAWRSDFYASEADYPATQPQHEMRKYVGDGFVARFAGLGRYGEEKVRRAEQLEDISRFRSLKDGFLYADYVPGQPLRGTTFELPLAAGRYLALRRLHLARSEPVRTEGIVEMIRVNVEEGIGPEWLGALETLEPPSVEAAVAVDGRVMPHKWIASERGIIKVDALDHANDHFYPGPCDIAWDLAGVIVEFDLGEGQASELLSCYERYSGDSEIHGRLAFYETAYRAFRLGYVTLAQQALGAGRESDRFEKLRLRYAEGLRQSLRQLAPL